VTEETDRYNAKWKCQLYGKITQKIQKAIQSHPKKRDSKADFKLSGFSQSQHEHFEQVLPPELAQSFSIRPKPQSNLGSLA